MHMYMYPYKPASNTGIISILFGIGEKLFNALLCIYYNYVCKEEMRKVHML